MVPSIVGGNEFDRAVSLSYPAASFDGGRGKNDRLWVVDRGRREGEIFGDSRKEEDLIAI